MHGMRNLSLNAVYILAYLGRLKNVLVEPFGTRWNRYSA